METLNGFFNEKTIHDDMTSLFLGKSHVYAIDLSFIAEWNIIFFLNFACTHDVFLLHLPHYNRMHTPKLKTGIL
jgi:hypothetical protein